MEPYLFFKVVTECFSSTCSTSPGLEMGEFQRNAPFEWGVCLDFWGLQAGTMSLAVYGNFLEPLTASMLGKGVSLTDELKRDALGELGNIVCGNLLPHIFGPRATFRLDAPRPWNGIDSPRKAAPKPAARMGLPFEGGRVEIFLFLEESVDPPSGAWQTIS